MADRSVTGLHDVRQALSLSLPMDRRLHDIVDAARIGAWEWNIQTGQLWLNARWAEMLGYTLAELEPVTIETCARLRHPDDQAAAVRKAERHLAGEEPYFEAEVRMRHKAGHWVWILDRARLVSRSEDGRPLIMVGAHQDITARKISEIDLAQARDRLSLCMDIAGLGVWEKDLTTGLFSIDPRIREIYGIPNDDLAWVDREMALGRIPEPDRNALAEDARWALETGRPVQSKFRVKTPEGDRFIEGHAIAASGREGQPVLLGVNRDVTDDVVRTAELEAKRVEAEAATVAKGQFLATMSHEIRTPMNGVIGMLEVLRRGDLAPDLREHAEIALQSATHLRHILDDILEVSRLEAGEVRLEPCVFDPRALVREVTDLFGQGVVPSGVELHAQIEEGVPRGLTADAARLRQILTNFVGNAVKFTTTGQIVVEVGYDAASAQLSVAVRDTGIGIAPEVRDRLFHRFVQGDASNTRRHGGTGLGLAICRQYVELMDGRIGIESEPGVGSRVWMEVPAPIGQPEISASDAPVVCAARPLRLLVAEDNETNQRVIAALLTTFGHSFTIVPDGAQAVAAVTSGDYDAILMDVQMPVMDGPTATRRIRELGCRAAMLPIIALTANAMPGQRAEYLAAGMTDYVSKPVDVRALFAALEGIG